MRLTLLTRSYCHLCDEMREALALHAASTPLDLIDVDAPEHAALEERFGDAVPVLFAGAPVPEREICRYRLDAGKLAAALAESRGIR